MVLVGVVRVSKNAATLVLSLKDEGDLVTRLRAASGRGALALLQGLLTAALVGLHVRHLTADLPDAVARVKAVVWLLLALPLDSLVGGVELVVTGGRLQVGYVCLERVRVPVARRRIGRPRALLVLREEVLEVGQLVPQQLVFSLEPGILDAERVPLTLEVSKLFQ